MTKGYNAHRFKRACLAVFFSGIILITGCGTAEEVPELIDPVINNESYRPVEYGNVSVRNIELANVMPEEYCVFYSEAAKVDEICVDVGQYVEEGTVLARMNTDELSERLAVCQENLEDINSIAQYNRLISEQKIKEQGYLRQDAVAAGDEEAVRGIDTRIAVLEENAGFDELLRKHQSTILNESIAKLSESINESTLVAQHSGYVTYVKDLESSLEAYAYENIVIVSDYDNIHLELAKDIRDTNYNNMIKREDNQIYILLNGEKKELEPIKYTNEELVAMERVGEYCKVRFELGDASSYLRLGDKIPVYFTDKSRENVLRIGQDSIYTDGRQSFVYVKTDTGKEKRDITIGVQNDMYAEVTEGLNEGEWVYYSSTSMMPESYDEYQVVTSDYSLTGGGLELKAQREYTRLYTYNNYEKADVIAVYAKKGSEVTKGELMCTLKSKEGSARKLELETSMEAAREEQAKTISSYDEGISELEAKIEAARYGQISGDTPETAVQPDSGAATTETAVQPDSGAATTETAVQPDSEVATTETVVQPDSEVATPTDAAEIPSATLLERLNCQKLIMEYEKEISIINSTASYRSYEREYNKLMENRNSEGYINIYSNQDGVIGRVYVNEGEEMDGKETELFQIYEAESEKLSFATYNDYVGVGCTAVITTEDGTAYEKDIIGNAGEEGKCYLVHKDDKVYVTTSNASEKAYISGENLPKDIDLTKAKVSYEAARLSDAIVLPVSAVRTEVKVYNPNKVYYYVWRLVDGKMVQQYVQIQDNLNTKTEICVLDGLEPGDKLAIEKVVE